MPKSFNYIFVDESGDPGAPYKKDKDGNKKPTGASLFYILSAVCLNSEKLFRAEKRILEIKNKFGYRGEIKSANIPLKLYKELLNILNELEIMVGYRLIDKTKYKGVFGVDGKKECHNVFDEYNLAKLVYFAVKKCRFANSEVVIDGADRRLLDGNFDNFNNYIKSKTNTKTIERVNFVTHVNSEYVNVMQISDLISGAIKDYFTDHNKDLFKIIAKKYLYKVY